MLEQSLILFFIFIKNKDILKLKKKVPKLKLKVGLFADIN